jgi:nicotinamidase-related amidase
LENCRQASVKQWNTQWIQLIVEGDLDVNGETLSPATERQSMKKRSLIFVRRGRAFSIVRPQLTFKQIKQKERKRNMNQYHRPYTPEDSAIVFIDFQPQMLFGVANADRATMINNVTLLAKVAKEFKVPTVLTSVETESFSGYVWPQLLDIFPGQPVIERSSMNSWDSMEFRKAIEATGRKNIIMTGLWTEVCVTWPTIEMLGAGYNVYVVQDCCGATSPAAQEAALSRMVQAGAVPLTTIGALLEWQRDWAKREHYDALMKLLRPQAGAYGVGVEYAYTMVHHAPQSAQKPQIVPKKVASDGHASTRGMTPVAAH